MFRNWARDPPDLIGIQRGAASFYWRKANDELTSQFTVMTHASRQL